jgi:DNA-binding response OmpR family regulator
VVYESNFLKYEGKFNRILYENTYIPLTQREILIVKLLIKRSFVSKEEIRKYLKAKLEGNYTDGYIRILIHRVKTKIKLSTGRELIRNKYGSGYYIL